jgi:hypothetical protein
MSIWTELEIEPSQDRGTLRRAYALRLRQVNPETDQVGFQRLREAYEEALRLAESPAATTSTIEIQGASMETPGVSAQTKRSPGLPLYETAVDLLQRLSDAPSPERQLMLSEAMRSDGRETLDFQHQLQRILARLLYSHFNRFYILVPLLSEYFGWDEEQGKVQSDPVVGELFTRSSVRSWRLDIENAAGPSTPAMRQAMQLLRAPINVEAFQRFARSKRNRSEMHDLLVELYKEYPAAVRYEVDAASADWWRRDLQSRAAPKQKRPSPRRSAAWVFVAFLMLVGPLARLISDRPSPSPMTFEPPASPTNPYAVHTSAPELRFDPKPAAPARAGYDLSSSYGSLFPGRNMGPWNPKSTYKIGDLVNFGGHRWKANTPNPDEVPGASSQWTRDD